MLFLQFIKLAGGISDNKFLIAKSEKLIVQYLFYSRILGEVPSRKEAADLCVTGETHKQRARQLLWCVTQERVERINMSKVIAVSCDLTGIDGSEQNIQHVNFWNPERDSPESFVLPSPPVGAKDAGHTASVLLDSCLTTDHGSDRPFLEPP